MAAALRFVDTQIAPNLHSFSEMIQKIKMLKDHFCFLQQMSIDDPSALNFFTNSKILIDLSSKLQILERNLEKFVASCKQFLSNSQSAKSHLNSPSSPKISSKLNNDLLEKFILALIIEFDNIGEKFNFFQFHHNFNSIEHSANFGAQFEDLQKNLDQLSAGILDLKQKFNLYRILTESS